MICFTGGVSASPRLVIDYGAVSTVAVLAWPDGQWTGLRFDEQQVLPSAVHTDPEGRTVTGHQAWRLADDTCGTFAESPLRTGTTADPAARESAQVLTAATLRRVTDEAARIAGEPVNEVRLVFPARWGPRRRTWLRGAAAQAGIPQPILIAAPVAVAGLLPTIGVPVRDDAALLIMDLGSGCEATVLRRTSTGFNVSSTVHDPDAGGDAIDKLLLTHINQLTAPPTTTATVQGSALSPDTTLPAGHDERRWALLAGVRAGKEALTYRATASVGLPPPAPAAIITTDTVRHTAHPVLHRAVTLAQQAIAAADIDADDLYGVYCIGAAANTPGVAEAITERLGIIPALLPHPETIAALGAAAATPDGEPPATTPPARGALGKLTAVIVPAAASLTLLTQFLLTTTSADRNPATDPVNWGELALASMFAVLACLAASPQLGTLLRQILIAQTHTPPVQPTKDSQLRYGTVLGATVGLGLTGVYAVFAALYANLPLGSALRWAVLPAACIAAASVTAVLATTHPPAKPQRARVRTANLMRFPPGAIALTTAGMLLVQYTLTIPRPPDLAIYLDLGTRIGGLLIGIGVAFTLVKALLLRLVLALPWGLLAAVIASSTTTGILATVFTLAVLCWCGYPLLNLLTGTSAPRTPQHDPT